MRHSPHRSFAARASALAVLPALAVLLVSLVAAPPAVADSMGFDARPSPGSPNAELGFFKIDAQPGAALQRMVVITNRTTQTKVIDLAACDGAAAVYGGVAYSDNAKKPSAVGSWIKLSSVQVDVPPNTSVQVPFEISVPADATSGTHVGGISMWEPAASKTTGAGGTGNNKATTKITMVTRMVLTVLITTPGPAVPQLTISGVKAEARPDGMYLIVAIASDGTAPAAGNGQISLPGDGFKQDFVLGDMIPQSSSGYPIKWKTNPAQGSYPGVVQIVYAQGAKVARWSGTIAVGTAQTKQLKNRLVVPAGSGGISWPIYAGIIGGVVLLIFILAVWLAVRLGMRRQRLRTS